MVRYDVAATLARLRSQVFTFAVVYEEHGWQPVMPPPGERWDYQPFTRLELALEAAAEIPAEAEPEVWAKSDGVWAEYRAVA
jgi:hypothetical protein